MGKKPPATLRLKPGPGSSSGPGTAPTLKLPLLKLTAAGESPAVECAQGEEPVAKRASDGLPGQDVGHTPFKRIGYQTASNGLMVSFTHPQLSSESAPHFKALVLTLADLSTAEVFEHSWQANSKIETCSCLKPAYPSSPPCSLSSLCSSRETVIAEVASYLSQRQCHLQRVCGCATASSHTTASRNIGRIIEKS